MSEKKGVAPLSREELERIRDGELAVTREQVRLTLCGDERGYAHDKSVRCDPPCEDCGSPHCAWTVLERQVRDLATTALHYIDLDENHDCGTLSAEAHIVRLKEGLRDLMPLTLHGLDAMGQEAEVFAEPLARVRALLSERSAPKDAAKDANDTEQDMEKGGVAE